MQPRPPATHAVPPSAVRRAPAQGSETRCDPTSPHVAELMRMSPAMGKGQGRRTFTVVVSIIHTFDVHVVFVCLRIPLESCLRLRLSCRFVI